MALPNWTLARLSWGSRRATSVWAFTMASRAVTAKSWRCAASPRSPGSCTTEGSAAPGRLPADGAAASSPAATATSAASSPIGLAVQSPDRLIVVTTERPGDLATTVVQAVTLDGAAPSSSTTTATSAPSPSTPPTTKAVPPPPACFGRPATIVGTARDDHFTVPAGEGPVVIVGLGGNDTFNQGYTTKPREVYFCGGSEKDTVTGIVARFDGGSGKDGIDTWKCARPVTLKSVERKKLSSRCPGP